MYSNFYLTVCFDSILYLMFLSGIISLSINCRGRSRLEGLVFSTLRPHTLCPVTVGGGSKRMLFLDVHRFGEGVKPAIGVTALFTDNDV